MKKNLKKVMTFVSALALVSSTVSGMSVTNNDILVKAATGSSVVENLDRGITAVNTGKGMLVSWRYLANDSDTAEYNLYRDDKLVYTSKSGDATCYLDSSGSSSSKYRVDYVSGGKVISSENCNFITNKSYFDIPLSVPTASGCTYSANDCAVGDVDGDGQYEIFLKWDPSNSKDNSQEGVTGNVFIDCYTLEGKRLWRVDLGKNIRAGAHYTQFLVADFDCDGKAEMTCKTADGTIDGTGKVIGDGSKDYRNSKGYILSGPEYYTLFDGATGKALDTVEYGFPRGKVSDWGDNYGNRVDRFLGAVVYCDGVKPSAVSVRGYYTRMTAVAYDVVDKKLVVRWKYDSGNDPKKGYHNGNHNCMPADVDNDGKQELVLGSTAIDDNGKLLWCNNQGHGDAMHLGDFLPDRAGLELWMCHENEPWGVSLIDAKTGKNIFHKDHTKDTGRACCGNILASNPGAEFWGATGNDIFDANGKTIATNKPAQNFMIYWDGDLEREILDGTKIDKYVSSSKINRLLTADGCASNNSSKSSPCLAADIFGDWREELLLRTSDSKYLRVYSTTYDTDVRLTTLMHDVQYRTQAAGEQNCYNQPAHPSFYLGSDEKLPSRPAVTVNGSSGNNQPSEPQVTEPPVTTVSTPVQTTVSTQGTPDTSGLREGVTYRIKNANSGLYLDVVNGEAANSANVQQWTGGDRDAVSWQLKSAGDGYYYVVSQVGDKSYTLDVSAKKTENGTNVEIYTMKEGENQKFKFVPNNDGTFKILTKISGDKSCVEVADSSKEQGANVQQWEVNNASCQNWYVENTDGSIVTPQGTVVTTTVTTAAPPVTSATPQSSVAPPVTSVTSTTVNNQTNVVYGDLDSNKEIDITDLTILSLYLLSDVKLNESQLEAADVNADGKVDIADLAHFKQYISKDNVVLGKK
ncbi:MAG: RICIN domain-containing protein [Oscillospiraceae bacterium]|nr:RICIN domain-containing protein [Oscillospiraceae bacterium]